MYLLLIYLLIFIFPFALLPRYILRGDAPYPAVLRSTLWTAALSAFIFMVASFDGQGLFAQVQGIIDEMSKEMAQNPMMQDALGAAAAEGTDAAELIGNIYSQAFKVLPATIMITGAVVSYFEYMLLAKILSRKHSVNKLPPFREFSFPGTAVTGIVGMYLVAWILTRMGAFGDDMMYANINSIFDFTFSIQGVSTVLMFCHMKRIPKAVGIIIALFLWFTVFGKMALVLLGMFDLIFGLKQRFQGKAR